MVVATHQATTILFQKTVQEVTSQILLAFNIKMILVFIT
jgi:hypothetical protein